MKVIRALRGQLIFVDNSDYELLNRHRWVVSSEGYARTVVNGSSIYMHRLVMPLRGSRYLDHINHNRLDNCLSNLRPATNSQNQHNRRNKNRYTGVTFHTMSQKWRARLTVNRKELYMGIYDTRNEAVAARQWAERKYVRL